MFVRVDDSEDNIEGFMYRDKDGVEESVELDPLDQMILIKDSVGRSVSIYKEDIEKLIKCLTLADKWFKENT